MVPGGGLHWQSGTNMWDMQQVGMTQAPGFMPGLVAEGATMLVVLRSGPVPAGVASEVGVDSVPLTTGSTGGSVLGGASPEGLMADGESTTGGVVFSSGPVLEPVQESRPASNADPNTTAPPERVIGEFFTGSAGWGLE